MNPFAITPIDAELPLPEAGGPGWWRRHRHVLLLVVVGILVAKGLWGLGRDWARGFPSVGEAELGGIVFLFLPWLLYRRPALWGPRLGWILTVGLVLGLGFFGLFLFGERPDGRGALFDWRGWGWLGWLRAGGGLAVYGAVTAACFSFRRLYAK